MGLSNMKYLEQYFRSFSRKVPLRNEFTYINKKLFDSYLLLKIPIDSFLIIFLSSHPTLPLEAST